MCLVRSPQYIWDSRKCHSKKHSTPASFWNQHVIARAIWFLVLWIWEQFKDTTSPATCQTSVHNTDLSAQGVIPTVLSWVGKVFPHPTQVLEHQWACICHSDDLRPVEWPIGYLQARMWSIGVLCKIRVGCDRSFPIRTLFFSPEPVHVRFLGYWSKSLLLSTVRPFDWYQNID